MRSAAKLNCHLLLPVPVGPHQRARTARATRAAQSCHRQPQKFWSFWVLSIQGVYRFGSAEIDRVSRLAHGNGWNRESTGIWRSRYCSTTGPDPPPGRRGFRPTQAGGESTRGAGAFDERGRGVRCGPDMAAGEPVRLRPACARAALRPHGAAAREGGLGAQRGGLTDARGQPNRDNTEQRKTLSRTSSANKWLRCDPAVRARGEPPRAGARGASARCGAPAPRFRA